MFYRDSNVKKDIYKSPPLSKQELSKVISPVDYMYKYCIVQ